MNPHLRPGRSNGPYHHGIISTPPACHRCPLRNKKKVLPDGPVPAKIAFVGEEPGNQEIRDGRGFVGPSGGLLWNQLADACGFSRQEVWVTNAALCKASDIILDSSATLPKDAAKRLAMECCRQRLLDELVTVDPVVVVPFGNYALRSLLDIPKAKIYGYRGSRNERDLKALADFHRQQGQYR